MICDCVRYTTQEGLDGWFDASRFVSCERVGDVTAIMLELSRGTIILTAKESPEEITRRVMEPDMLMRSGEGELHVVPKHPA